MNLSEIWQVEVNNQIYEANLEELGQWIAEGALLPADKIRRGNLRWLEAGKVPHLHAFFNAKQLGLPMPVVTTVNDASGAEENQEPKSDSFSNTQSVHQYEFSSQTEEIQDSFQNKAVSVVSPQTNTQSQNACHFHPEEEPKFVCQECANLFCKSCPKSYGGTVKICPVCDSMCKPVAEVLAKNKKNFQYQTAVTAGFGFADFGNALAYPFRFKTSLIFGAVIFMVLTLGQAAASVGSIILFACSIICVMLANALTFACLANTIESFSQGNLEADFMPSFDDFSLWDDVVHPFFLSIGAYLVSFAPLILVVVVTMFFPAEFRQTFNSYD